MTWVTRKQLHVHQITTITVRGVAWMESMYRLNSRGSGGMLHQENVLTLECLGAFWPIFGTNKNVT